MVILRPLILTVSISWYLHAERFATDSIQVGERNELIIAQPSALLRFPNFFSQLLLNILA